MRADPAAGYVVPAVLRGAMFVPWQAPGRREPARVSAGAFQAAGLPVPEHPGQRNIYQLTGRQGLAWTPGLDAQIRRRGGELLGHGHLILVDIDSPAAADGSPLVNAVRWLADHAVAAGALLDMSATVSVRTPGHPASAHLPGWHLWYRADPARPVHLGPLSRCHAIELRTRGTCPGSPGYLVRSHPDELMAWPPWLAGLAGPPPAPATATSTGHGGVHAQARLAGILGCLRRWDVAARRFDKVTTLGTSQPEGRFREGMVSVSPSGRTLAVSTQFDNGVYVVDASTFRRIAGPVGAGFTGVSAFSPNGQMLALAPLNNGPGLTLVDMPSGRVRWENRSLADALSLAFSPDGRRIVAGSSEGTIATFDTQSGRRLAGPRVAHPEFVDAVAFAPGGRIILSGGVDGTVRLWDAADLRPLGGPLRVSDNAGAFATFSADGARILALDATSRITTWDATIGKWRARACSIVGGRDFTPEERTVFSITPENPRPCP